MTTTSQLHTAPPNASVPGPREASPGRWSARAARMAIEFVVIVTGVLVALAAQSWYQTRSDRELERGYLLGLHASVRSDIEQIRQTQLLLETEKWPGIGYVRDVITGAITEPEPHRLITALDSSASLGWTIPPRAMTVYQELVSTGRLVLLRDTDVRSGIAAYHGHATQTRDRVYARRTDYPRLVASLVPAGDRSLARQGQSPATETVQRLIARIREPTFSDMLNAEEYYARFLMQSLEEEEARAQRMLERLVRALGEDASTSAASRDTAAAR